MESIAIKIKASYRGYELKFSEWGEGKWSVAIGEERSAYSSTDIKKVKEYVDKLIKSTFKPVQAFYGCYFPNEIKEITITSLDSADPKSVWISDKEKHRSKVSKDYCYDLTNENRNRIDAIIKIQEDIENLQKEQSCIVKSLTKISL